MTEVGNTSEEATIRKCGRKTSRPEIWANLRRGEDGKYGNIERNVFRNSEAERKINSNHKTLWRQDQQI